MLKIVFNTVCEFLRRFAPMLALDAPR